VSTTEASGIVRVARIWRQTRHHLRRPFFRRLWGYIRWNLTRRRLRLVFVKTKCGVEPVRNYLIDRRYGGWCGGTFQTSFSRVGNYGTSSADYSMLPKLFDERNGVVVSSADVLVDVGCGRGRVINWWLSLGLGNKIVGIEMEERFAAEAEARLAPYPNVTVVSGNALDHIPPDATIFYLFNPFGGSVLRDYKDRLMQVFGPAAGITIVYHYACHANVFEDDPRWIVEPVRTKTFHPSVIIRMAPVGQAAEKAPLSA
jgi:hypothetical protein